MTENISHHPTEHPLSERNLPLIHTAATFWAGFVPEASRQVFFDALVGEMSRVLDKPEDPRRRDRQYPNWLPVSTYEFGTGVHPDERGVESDIPIRHALKATGETENLHSLLPRQTHTVIDIENGTVFLHEMVVINGEKHLKRTNIFPTVWR
ncbi:MAG TPA: hypothetical protein VFQ63_00715 [Patescibacteria group bacterium]|nr:hypothetical protein [Patescibacteria group bacterium]